MNGWDRFLTEQDRQHLEIWGKRAPDGVGTRPVLLVVEKVCASAFAGRLLLHHLRAQGADTVIVCGESTGSCVRAAVVDAVTCRYRVGVVGACCFDRTQASHWMNLFDMHQMYADMIDVAAAARYFASVARWSARGAEGVHTGLRALITLRG